MRIAISVVSFSAVLFSSILAAQPQDPPKFTGPGSCAAPSCHGSVQVKTETAVQQTEYSTWVVRDKHADFFRKGQVLDKTFLKSGHIARFFKGVVKGKVFAVRLGAKMKNPEIRPALAQDLEFLGKGGRKKRNVRKHHVRLLFFDERGGSGGLVAKKGFCGSDFEKLLDERSPGTFFLLQDENFF